MRYKTTQAQRDAQKTYRARMHSEGFRQIRAWVPEELQEWHEAFVKRARAWKEFDAPLELPPLPEGLKKAK